MLKKFDDVCRKKGLSITVQRQRVFQMLCGTTAHPTVDTVYESVRQSIPSISRATVYRTLEKLADEGLIRRVVHPDSVARYDANAAPHHHLVCIHCGKTEDVHFGTFDIGSYPNQSNTGFIIIDHEIVFRGICPECQAKQREMEQQKKVDKRKKAIVFDEDEMTA